MKRLWISGWAISPAWFAKQAQTAWPEDQHAAVSPSGAAAALAKGGYDSLGGYSLGALWLLRHAHLVPNKTPAVLLAPIFAFMAEAGRGGRVRKAVLGVQRQRLRKNAPDAVTDFFARSGLGNTGLTEALAELSPARIAELVEELDWLRDWSADPPPHKNWKGFAGDDDALLDAHALKQSWPTLRILPGAGHTPPPLLREAAKQDRASTIIRSFDAAAENYGARATPQSLLAHATAQLVGPQERRGAAVEFGAGTGLFTRAMQPWEGAYLATDAAARMVAVGRKLCPAPQWRQREADNTSGLESAQWIFACNLLQWLDEPGPALRNWRGLLTPRGRMVAAILLPETLGELRAVLPGTDSLSWRNAEEWRELLMSAGFAIEQTEIWEHTSRHPSALALLRDLHAMGLAPWRAVGPGRLRAALREYDRRFASQGGVSATWRAWLVRATATT